MTAFLGKFTVQLDPPYVNDPFIRLFKYAISEFKNSHFQTRLSTKPFFENEIFSRELKNYFLINGFTLS